MQGVTVLKKLMLGCKLHFLSLNQFSTTKTYLSTPFFLMKRHPFTSNLTIATKQKNARNMCHETGFLN